MFKMQYFIKWLFLLIFPVVICVWGVEAADGFDFDDIEQTTFKFSDHLDSSSTWMLSRSGEETTGQWTSGRFLFSGASSNAEVKKTSHIRNLGSDQQAISFNTFENIKRVIEFKEVPSAKTLKLTYGVISEKAKEEPLSYINFRIWLGQHKLREFRLQNNTGWHDFEIPLGIYSFLNRPGIFRFELFSDSPKPIAFSFDAELIPVR